MHGIETLKKRINGGELVIGVSAPLSTSADRLKGVWEQDDYGFVSTDSQHGAFSEERLAKFCAASEELGIPVIFRIKHTYLTFLVGNLLDLGPSGIEVPQVEEEATVEEAVRYFYYPQIGKRSWGGVARVGIRERSDRLAYAKWWNDRGILWMQIESLRSVTGARRLAKQGVDCLSWGPADLSFDRESHPEHPLQTDDDCVAHVVKVLEGTGTRLMVRSYDPGLREKYQDMGVTVLLEAPKV